MAINSGRRHQQRRRRRGSGNAVDGVSSQSQTLSDSQGNVVDRVSSQSQTSSDSQGNIVDGVSSQSQTLSDSPLVKPVSHLSRRQQRDELVRRRKLSEIEQRRNLMKNTNQPSSSDSTFQSPFFYDIDEGSSDSATKEPFIYKVRGVPVPCAVCGGPHSTVCCPYFCSFPRDGHLVDDRAFVVICECGMTIVDDRCPSGYCFPRRLRRVAFKNLDHIPPYDPTKYGSK